MSYIHVSDDGHRHFECGSVTVIGQGITPACISSKQRDFQHIRQFWSTCTDTPSGLLWDIKHSTWSWCTALPSSSCPAKMKGPCGNRCREQLPQPCLWTMAEPHLPALESQGECYCKIIITVFCASLALSTPGGKSVSPARLASDPLVRQENPHFTSGKMEGQRSQLACSRSPHSDLLTEVKCQPSAWITW